MNARQRQVFWKEVGFDAHGFWKDVEAARKMKRMPWKCWFKLKRDAHEKHARGRRG